MHGRLKVKTTAEQEAEKQKERKKKLELYTQSYNKATEKRNLKEYDDEALAITGQILQYNPDIYTIWNLRNEVLEHMITEKSDNVDEIQKLLENELHLTEACLRKNPKSYGAWHHRAWSLKAMPKPNWKKEINICSRYLDLDERNFHCWNHRKLVCKLANELPEEELAFTLKKIEDNFSNYSAWHYRSSLLPLVHPGRNAFGPSIDQDTLHQEFEYVQNAAFTDPNDQSAWFYHRWLLGRAECEQCLLCCHLDKDQSRVIAVLCKPIKKKSTDSLSILVENNLLNGDWRTPEDEDFASCVWYYDISSPSQKCSEIEVIFDNGEHKDSLKCTSSLNTIWNVNFKDVLFSSQVSASTTEVLQQELESCQQLLDMEPDNKWTLLTCVLLLRTLDSVAHEETVFLYLDKLVAVDAKRKHYYMDLKSRCAVENSLATFLSSQTISTSLDLSKRSLTLFCHAEHLVFLQALDLSNNALSSLHSLKNLICLEKLVLDFNNVEDCSGLENMKYLRTLSLNNNCIKHFANLFALKSCTNLQTFHLLSNPIAEESEFVERMKIEFPYIKYLN